VDRMFQWMREGTLAIAVLLAIQPTLPACTFCAGGYASRQTIREQATGATLVVHGTLADSRFTPDGRGTTDLRVTSHLKSDPKLAKPATITIPQYLPVVGDTPRDYLLFASVADGKPDMTGGLSLPATSLEYVKTSLTLPANDPVARLAYYFTQLDAKDATVSADAFLEFAKASDADLAKAAKGFDAKKLKTWLVDPATPADRLGVYSLLLGLCGNASDIATFQTLLAVMPRTERISTNLGGILAGLTLLDAKQGWAKIAEIACHPKAPFDERLAAIGTIRFFQATKPESSRPEIVSIYRSLASQGDLADVAAEDLRRWGWWDLTAEVLAPFEQPTHKAPIVRQALVRYALTCPDPAAKTFLESARKSDAKLVERVEEGLKQFAIPKK
jgi:hypothetical protein